MEIWTKLFVVSCSLLTGLLLSVLMFYSSNDSPCHDVSFARRRLNMVG